MIKDVKPYKSEKAKLLDVLLTNKDYIHISKSDDHSVADGTIVDPNVLIKSIASFAVSKYKDFTDFADSVLDNLVGQCKNSTRIDIVNDMFYRHSIKGPTSKSRCTRWAGFIFDRDAELPSDFDDFLQNEDNKSSSLNLFIATRTEAIYLGSKVGCVVCITKSNTVIDCKDGEACHMYTNDNLTLEEADNRINYHIGHMIKADNLTSILVPKSGQQIC